MRLQRNRIGQRAATSPNRVLRVKRDAWKSKMNALRFLIILAAAVAAWMVLMWFSLAAVSAAPIADSSTAQPAPACATEADDASALLPSSAGQVGARWTSRAAAASTGGAA